MARTLQDGLTSFFAGVLAHGPATVQVLSGNAETAVEDSPVYLICLHPQAAVRGEEDDGDAIAYVVGAPNLDDALASTLGQGRSKSVAIYGGVFKPGSHQQLVEGCSSVLENLQGLAERFAEQVGEPSNTVRH